MMIASVLLHKMWNIDVFSFQSPPARAKKVKDGKKVEDILLGLFKKEKLVAYNVDVVECSVLLLLSVSC